MYNKNPREYAVSSNLDIILMDGLPACLFPPFNSGANATVISDLVVVPS